MKVEAMRLPKSRAESLLKIAREAKIYKLHKVKFLEESGSHPNETKILIEADSNMMAGLAQGYLITVLQRLNTVN